MALGYITLLNPTSFGGVFFTLQWSRGVRCGGPLPGGVEPSEAGSLIQQLSGVRMRQ